MDIHFCEGVGREAGIFSYWRTGTDKAKFLLAYPDREN